MRIATTLAIAAVLSCTTLLSASAQSLTTQQVTLDSQSASRALDAIPAVFVVAQNVDGAEIDLSADGMASGFSDLADETAALDQLTAALGAYGFEGYPDWAATVRTIFTVYGFIRSERWAAPMIDRALQQILSDPGIPQIQKDAIVDRMDGLPVDIPETVGAPPTEQNLMVVIELVPHIETTIETMRAMR